MLGDKLTKPGIMVNHASGDADFLIVQTALKAAKDYHIVLIGEDTDLLVLTLHHFMKKLFTLHMNQKRASNWQKFGISVMQSKF